MLKEINNFILGCCDRTAKNHIFYLVGMKLLSMIFFVTETTNRK